ncbi:MAG: HypC/HybG/HupF family hydrogenase formation chaperone [Chitinophagales bacterium]|nr:HypC/HybG/HupF family hydrogenase formation chaperone [Chitinophagales bacterium]
MCLAIPGRIKSIEPFKEGYMSMGKVELGGIIKEINLQLVPDAKENDYVLVHVGVAISIVDEEEAKSSLKFLEQMNELDELYNTAEDNEITKEERVKQGDDIISKMIP